MITQTERAHFIQSWLWIAEPDVPRPDEPQDPERLHRAERIVRAGQVSLQVEEADLPAQDRDRLRLLAAVLPALARDELGEIVRARIAKENPAVAL